MMKTTEERIDKGEEFYNLLKKYSNFNGKSIHIVHLPVDFEYRIYVRQGSVIGCQLQQFSKDEKVYAVYRYWDENEKRVRSEANIGEIISEVKAYLKRDGKKLEFRTKDDQIAYDGEDIWYIYNEKVYGALLRIGYHDQLFPVFKSKETAVSLAKTAFNDPILEVWINAGRHWSEYPIGTKAKAITGGYWIKTERGWKWSNGSTFPTPGADATGEICLPLKPLTPKDIKEEPE